MEVAQSLFTSYQVTWLKLMHRNLYLAPHKEDPDDTVLARSAANTTEPADTFNKMPGPDNYPGWSTFASAKNPPKILQGPDHHTHEKMGLPRFTHTSRQPSLLLDACQTHSSQVVGKNHAGILFLAWRCLYMLSA
jgi:hypothetical protein